MGNHSKLIGSVVGSVLGVLAALAIVPEDFVTPENVATITAGIGAIVGVGAAIFTYFFPANRDA